MTNYKDWLDEYIGCLICDCEHGCQQWIERNELKAHLLIQAYLNNYRQDNFNKIAKMSKERLAKITKRMSQYGSPVFERKDSFVVYLLIRGYSKRYRKKNIEKIKQMDSQRSRKIFYKMWRMEVLKSRRNKKKENA